MTIDRRSAMWVYMLGVTAPDESTCPFSPGTDHWRVWIAAYTGAAFPELST